MIRLPHVKPAALLLASAILDELHANPAVRLPEGNESFLSVGAESPRFVGVAVPFKAVGSKERRLLQPHVLCVFAHAKPQTGIGSVSEGGFEPPRDLTPTRPST